MYLNWFENFYYAFKFFYVFTAAGLYYLAEIVEEYTVMAKAIISWTVIVSKLKIYIWQSWHRSGQTSWNMGGVAGKVCVSTLKCRNKVFSGSIDSVAYYYL